MVDRRTFFKWLASLVPVAVAGASAKVVAPKAEDLLTATVAKLRKEKRATWGLKNGTVQLLVEGPFIKFDGTLALHVPTTLGRVQALHTSTIVPGRGCPHLWELEKALVPTRQEMARATAERLYECGECTWDQRPEGYTRIALQGECVEVSTSRFLTTKTTYIWGWDLPRDDTGIYTRTDPRNFSMEGLPTNAEIRAELDRITQERIRDFILQAFGVPKHLVGAPSDSLRNALAVEESQYRAFLNGARPAWWEVQA